MTTAPLATTPWNAERARVLAIVCLCALLVLGLAWELWLSPLRPGGSWWAIKVLPLAWTLAGVLKRRLATYRWLSLLVWLYVTEGLVRATTEPAPGAWLALAQLLLALGLFGACVLHIRARPALPAA